MTAYLLAIMLAALPLERQAPEPPAAALARYEAIAAAVAHVAETDEPAFGGTEGRRRSAVLMLAVSYHESSWRAGVDDGTVRGDGGRSWCLMQVNLGKGRTLEGWTGPELAADRRRCFGAGLAMLRRSVNACRNSHPFDRLAVYASGRCNVGREASRARMRTADRWWAL